MVKLLIKYGANPNSTNFEIFIMIYGNNSLHFASLNNNLEILKFIFNIIDDINCKNNEISLFFFFINLIEILYI